MSFDVFLQSFDRGVAASTDRGAVVAELKRLGLRADGSGVVDVETPDGGRADLDLGGDDGRRRLSGVAFLVHVLSEQVSSIVYEVARSGGMVVLPAMEPLAPILTDVAHGAHLPAAERWAPPIVCTGADELHAMLSRGFDDFAGYRDDTVGTA